MTIFRSLTDAQLAERHDPTPMLDSFNGTRYPLGGGNEYRVVFAPRVEMIPSRDRAPWYDPEVDMYQSPDDDLAANVVWAPRPEYARPPVNRILEAFRKESVKHQTAVLEGWQIGSIDFMATGDYNPAATPAEVEHARRVLTRLAALTETGDIA